MLNHEAFEALEAKYSAIAGLDFQLHFAEALPKAYFVSSNAIEGLLKSAQSLYAARYSDGNQRTASSKLQAKIWKAEDFSWSMARTGFLVGTGLLLALEAFQEAKQLYQEKTGNGEHRVESEYLLQVCA